MLQKGGFSLISIDTRPCPFNCSYIFVAKFDKPKSRSDHFALHIGLGHTREDEDPVSKFPMHCGWCGSNKNRCKLQLVKGKIVHICHNNLANARIRKTTFDTSPNKPVICQVCNKPVWLLNLASHREEEHPGIEAKVSDVMNLEKSSGFKKGASAALTKIQSKKRRKKRKASQPKQNPVIKKEKKT